MWAFNPIIVQLRRTLAVLCLSRSAAEGYGSTREDARRSFHTLWFEFPYTIAVAYIVDTFYINKFGVVLWVYFTYRVWSYFLKLLVVLWLVKIHAEWQGAGQHFYRWVIGFNWMNVLTDLLIFPLFLWSIQPGWVREDLIVMGTSTYLFIIFSYWALTWRTLKVNPFYAAGVGMIPVFVGDMLFNFVNFKLYGSMRPFFDLP